MYRATKKSVLLNVKHPVMKLGETELPQWQKDILDARRLFVEQPGQLLSMEDFLIEMEQESYEEGLTDQA